MKQAVCPRLFVLLALALLLLCPAVSGFRPSLSRRRLSLTGVAAKNDDGSSPEPKKYSDSVRGLNGFKFLFALAIAGELRSQFSSVELRTTTVCPSGYNSERTLAAFKANDKDFHCLPLGELARRFLTDPLVLPGDPAYDPSVFRVEMRGLKQSAPLTRADGSPLQL